MPDTSDKLINAFNPSGLVDSFVDYAPFILAGLGILIGIGVVLGLISSIRNKLSGSKYWGGSIKSTISNYRHRNDW